MGPLEGRIDVLGNFNVCDGDALGHSQRNWSQSSSRPIDMHRPNSRCCAAKEITLADEEAQEALRLAFEGKLFPGIG